MSNRYDLLFLSAAPHHWGRRINTGKEQRQIRGALRSGGFELDSVDDVTALELEKSITRSNAPIIHFSGHGAEEGLMLTDEFRIASAYGHDKLIALLASRSHTLAVLMAITAKMNWAEVFESKAKQRATPPPVPAGSKLKA